MLPPGMGMLYRRFGKTLASIVNSISVTFSPLFMCGIAVLILFSVDNNLS
jgi:hypothetical protein